MFNGVCSVLYRWGEKTKSIFNVGVIIVVSTQFNREDEVFHEIFTFKQFSKNAEGYGQNS